MNHHHQALAPLKPVVEQPPLTLYFADVFSSSEAFLYFCILANDVVSCARQCHRPLTTVFQWPLLPPACLMYVNLRSPFLYQCPTRPPIYPSSDQSSHPLVIRAAILFEVTVSCIPSTFVPFDIVPSPFYINQVVFKISPWVWGGY